MSNGCQQWEQRSAGRHAMPGKLWWLGERDDDFALGWTANSSRSGVAFITSAGEHVRVGETVSVSRIDPHEHFAECETLRVCRVGPYGPSLRLIACSRFR